MTASLEGGIAAAVAAAACYGCAPVAQAWAARQEATGAGIGVRLTARLARRPVWLLGVGGEGLGFVLEAYAFSAAPATLVAPLMTTEVLIFAMVAARVFRGQVSSLGMAGVGTIVVGAALLAAAFADDGRLGDPATTAEMIGLLALCAVVVAAATIGGVRSLTAARRALAAALFSGAAGIAYGTATVLTRQVGRTFTLDEPLRLLTTVTPYALAVVSLLGVMTLQRGLQISPLIAFPLTSSASALLPVLVGTAVLDDPVPTGFALAEFSLALVLMVMGVFLLCYGSAAVRTRRWADTSAGQEE